MIIVLLRSARSAVAIAGHLRGAITQGPFVVYRSNDYRAIKLATRLTRRKALLLNTLLRNSSIIGIFGGAALLSFFESSYLAVQAGQLCFYLGVACGMCLIGLEAFYRGNSAAIQGNRIGSASR